MHFLIYLKLISWDILHYLLFLNCVYYENVHESYEGEGEYKGWELWIKDVTSRFYVFFYYYYYGVISK